MSRPPSPQFVETNQGWSWTWKTWTGIDSHRVEHEVELEWLREVESWKVRRRYDRAGWTDPLVVADLAEPESFDHADQLAREYAARP